MYIWGMSKSYSIADARNALPRLVHRAERGDAVEITRRGRPVAVLLSLAEYARLTGGPRSFAEAYELFCEDVDPADRELDRDFFDGLRDRSAGRDVEL